MLFRLFSQRQRIETRTLRPRMTVRPRLEALEDRQLPSATYYQAVNLVSDQAGHAKIQDTSLVNAWGIAVGVGGGNFWISDNGTGLTTLYNGDVNGSPLKRNDLVVNIPGGAPTGQLFNDLITEGEAVAKKLGIELHGDPRQLVQKGANAPGKHRASMLQDVLAKRQTEVDFMNGAIAQWGDKVGVPTPLNRAVWELIKGLEHSWSDPD